MYKINQKDDFKYLTFSNLDKYDDLLHCFTTRFGGVSEGCFQSMNLGTSTGDDPQKLLENYEILAEKLSINIYDIVKTNQSHTSNIRYTTDSDKDKIFEDNPGYSDVDGLITDKRNIVLVTTHADCTPVFFYDNIKKIIGVAHSGWRGTFKNIAGKMINRFVNDFESNAKDIKVAIGPSLGQCCFEVDSDVAEIFLNENKDYEDFMKIKGQKYHFNLWAINEYLLVKEGVLEENIEVSGVCTKCNNDMFFSHRGQNGKRGVMGGIIMMK